MSGEDELDPDIEAHCAWNVERGRFATIEEARADFWAKLDESIAQADAGQFEELGVAWARIRKGLTDLPRAAE